MRSKPRLPDPEVNLPKEHPLHEAALLIAAAAVMVMAAFFAVAYFVDAVLLLVPPSAEASALPWPTFVTSANTAKSAEQSHLEALLSALVEGFPDNPYQFKVSIIEDEKAPNAFALPGGLILVTRGLLNSVESENELAMVLGHELGHFKNRDHLRSLGRGVLFSLLLAGAGFAADNPLLSTTSGLMSLRHGRGQESRADAFGLHLVAAHYGHVAGSGDFFARMQAESSRRQDGVPAFVRTHPRSANRINALRRLAAKAGYSTQGDIVPWPPTAH